MVPGFLCTTKFFRKNAEVLSKKYRVILMDPRGQGYSSKTLLGNTLKRNAQDIKELIDYLGLNNVILLGWSLASSTVIQYAADFHQHKLIGLVTMDGSLYPCSKEDWNHHRARNYDLENWFDTYLPLLYNPDLFYQKFISRISNQDGMDDEMKKMIEHECRKTLPWSALELHYDFIHTNNVEKLSEITVPYAAFGAKSEAYGLDMIKMYVTKVKGYSEIDEFFNSGHLMFIYESEKFNRCLSAFVEKAIALTLKGD
jgi:non-heme chloroperoxidase